MSKESEDRFWILEETKICKVKGKIISQMVATTKKVELAEAFIDAWRREECLWDITSDH